MNANVEHEWQAITIPDDAELGTTFALTATATLVEKPQRLLEIRSEGGHVDYVIDETTSATLSLRDVKLERR